MNAEPVRPGVEASDHTHLFFAHIVNVSLNVEPVGEHVVALADHDSLDLLLVPVDDIGHHSRELERLLGSGLGLVQENWCDRTVHELRQGLHQLTARASLESIGDGRTFVDEYISDGVLVKLVDQLLAVEVRTHPVLHRIPFDFGYEEHYCDGCHHIHDPDRRALSGNFGVLHKESSQYCPLC